MTDRFASSTPLLLYSSTHLSIANLSPNGVILPSTSVRV